MKQGVTCTFVLFYRTTDNEITLNKPFRKIPCQRFTLHRGLSVRKRHEKYIGS